jgi:hypothetical protein
VNPEAAGLPVHPDFGLFHPRLAFDGASKRTVIAGTAKCAIRKGAAMHRARVAVQPGFDLFDLAG